MKLLFLSLYFPPDLSAGSFRAKALLEALKKVCPEGLEIDLVASQPNRYANMASDVDEFEDHGWLRVRRISLPDHKSGMQDQALAYRAYYSAVQSLSRSSSWDGVIATSSRLMTAATGAKVARKQGIPLYLDIRDLFVDTLGDILTRPHHRPIFPILRQIEKSTMRTARAINVVSPGFESYIKALAPKSKITTFTNGIDDEFLQAGFTRSQLPMEHKRPLRILYAGNIGQGQGLHTIIPPAAKMLHGRARFRIIGDGGNRSQLAAQIEDANIDDGTIELLPPVSRAELIEEYRAADILFMHLNDLNAFHKVLPSKLFEYAATQKPVLSGVAGEAAEFVSTHLPDMGVFSPCDVNGLVAAFDRITAPNTSVDRSKFIDDFARSRIMERMAHDILAYFGRSKRKGLS